MSKFVTYKILTKRNLVFACIPKDGIKFGKVTKTLILNCLVSYLFLFPYFIPPLPFFLLQQLQPGEKRSQKNFIAHLKEISLLRYESDKTQVSEMNKLKLHCFHGFVFEIYSYIL